MPPVTTALLVANVAIYLIQSSLLPSLLFPFARQIIASVTSDGGFPPFMLDPIDFAGVYTARKAQALGGETIGNA